uniref:RNA-directed RNA polymerase 2a n=1 Tax=Apple necrotic mosaic virus TaxID=1779339 RepID=A0A5K6L9J7_9BROM|nr:polymerase [Apple necrotic mosaic virus]
MDPLYHLVKHAPSAVRCALSRRAELEHIREQQSLEFRDHWVETARRMGDVKTFNDLVVGYVLVEFFRPKFERIFKQFVGTEAGPWIVDRWAMLFDIPTPPIEIEYTRPSVSMYEQYAYIDEEYEEILRLEALELAEAQGQEHNDVPMYPTESPDESILDRNYEDEEVLTPLPTTSSSDCGAELGSPTDVNDLTIEVETDMHALDDEVPALPKSSLQRVTVSTLPLVPMIEGFETNQLMLVKEIVVDKFEMLLESHDRVLARNDWRSLAMYIPNCQVPDCSDILEMPVRHTQPEFIQMAIDELLPGVADVDDRFFQELVETDDICLELDRATIDQSVFNDWVPRSDKKLQGVFRTGNTSKRVPTFREAALAIKKRNLNVPDLKQVMFDDDEARKIANRFINTVIDPNKLAQFPGYISEGEVGYYNKYLTGKNIDPDLFVDPCALVSMDKYRHMIKTQLKPVEDTSQVFERSLPATITYHDKGKVMSTSPIFLMMCNRLLLCLNDKISIPSGKYHQLFSLDPFAFEMTKEFKEIDFSKFDKSQQRLHHLIQFHIFTALGADHEFLDMWFGSHEISHIRDGPCGIGFSVNYQRRTGDACTYLGNTIITLSALAYMYDLLDPNITFVIASGDDSLIGSVNPLNRDTEFMFTTLFNFEAKFPHNQAFVCSKFLCLLPTKSGGKKVLAVPNALKLNIKLGVKDLAPEAFDAWYESWLDLTWYFKHYLVVSMMRDYISHRYARKQTLFQEGAMLAYGTIFANKEKCLKSVFGITSKDLEKMKPKSRCGEVRAQRGKTDLSKTPRKWTDVVEHTESLNRDDSDERITRSDLIPIYEEGKILSPVNRSRRPSKKNRSIAKKTGKVEMNTTEPR